MKLYWFDFFVSGRFWVSGGSWGRIGSSMELSSVRCEGFENVWDGDFGYSYRFWFGVISGLRNFFGLFCFGKGDGRVEDVKIYV